MERRGMLEEALETIRRVANREEEIRDADRLRAAELLAKYAAALDDGVDDARISINFYEDYGDAE